MKLRRSVVIGSVSTGVGLYLLWLTGHQNLSINQVILFLILGGIGIGIGALVINLTLPRPVAGLPTLLLGVAGAALAGNINHILIWLSVASLCIMLEGSRLYLQSQRPENHHATN